MVTCGRFWSLAIKTTPPVTQRRFISSFKDYLDSVVQQAADRDNDEHRTIDSYLENRRENIGSRPPYALLELGLNIPEEILELDVIKELEVYASDMIILDNVCATFSGLWEHLSQRLCRTSFRTTKSKQPETIGTTCSQFSCITSTSISLAH